MENKVGDNVPEHEKLSKLLGRLQAVVEELRAFGVTLDDYDRKRLLHPRTGSDAHVTRVIELARKYSVVIPATPLDGIANDVRLAAELPPFEAQMASAQRLIEDTLAQAQSEYWEGFLAYYGALSAMARSIPELATELQPVVDFMATGKRQPKKPALPGPRRVWRTIASGWSTTVDCRGQQAPRAGLRPDVAPQPRSRGLPASPEPRLSLWPASGFQPGGPPHPVISLPELHPGPTALGPRGQPHDWAAEAR